MHRILRAILVAIVAVGVLALPAAAHDPEDYLGGHTGPGSTERGCRFWPPPRQ